MQIIAFDTKSNSYKCQCHQVVMDPKSVWCRSSSLKIPNFVKWKFAIFDVLLRLNITYKPVKNPISFIIIKQEKDLKIEPTLKSAQLLFTDIPPKL